MVEANRFKLGIFIAAALLLSVASLVYVGLDEYFKPKLRVFTVFRDSVEGLKVGSPVKFKGVTLGKVDRIAVRYGEGGIDVYMTLFPSSLDVIENAQYIKSVSDRVIMDKYVKALTDGGACCSLQSSGLMGGLFVNVEEKGEGLQGVFRVRELPPDYIYIPSRTSHVSNVIENISKTAEMLASIDVVKLDKELTATIKNANTILEKLGDSNFLVKAEETFEKIGVSIDKLASVTDKETIEATLRELRDCLNSVNQLSQKIDEKTNGLNQFRNRVSHTLSKIDVAMEKVSSLAENIDEDPSSILRGKSKPRIINKAE